MAIITSAAEFLVLAKGQQPPLVGPFIFWRHKNMLFKINESTTQTVKTAKRLTEYQKKMSRYIFGNRASAFLLAVVNVKVVSRDL